METAFSVKPLVLRHGLLKLDFDLYPREPKEFYQFPISQPTFWRQRLYAEGKSPFIPKDELEGQEEKDVKVLPFVGAVLLHPRTAWELYKSLSLLLEGEQEHLLLSILDEWSKNPIFTFYTLENSEKFAVYLKVQGQTKSHELKRSRFLLSPAEIYEIIRYFRRYAQMELVFIKGLQTARFFRWTEDYFLYDVPPATGVISPTMREKTLEVLSNFLEGKQGGIVGYHDRLTIRHNTEKDVLTISIAGGPPMDLQEEQVKELFMFLK